MNANINNVIIYAKHVKRAFMLALCCMLLCCCNRVPDHVIDPDDMAELLADIHTADAVVEANYEEYSSDSARQALKQAIFDRHGVTADDVDTSMMWYGAHLDKYMKVYDEAEEILQDRLNKSSAIAASSAGFSVSGDSVDVWQVGRRYDMDSRSATQFLTFEIKADANSKTGDAYTWRAKFHNNRLPVHWGIVADYADGSVEVLEAQFGSDGWQTLNFYTDSTRVLKEMYGYMRVDLSDNRSAVYIDSIQLVRNRLDAQRYVQRYRQRHYNNLYKTNE